MTTTQIAKMRAGRVAQLMRQREADIETVALYRAWLRDERQAYAALEDARDMELDAETIENLRGAWHEVISAMPDNLPPDSSPAWS